MTDEILALIEKKLDEQRECTKAELSDVVEKKVNGKIAEIKKLMEDHNKKHEGDMEEIKPVLKILSGGKILGESMKWLGGVGAAWIILQSLFKGN